MVGRAWLLTAIVGALITGIPVCCPASEITIGLTYEDKAVDCVIKNSRDMSNYCLTIYHDGQRLANQDFTCSLDDIQVYKCSSDGKCTAYGALKDNTIPSGSHSCPGIPFANINKNHVGRYTCLLHDSNATASFNVSYCKDGDKLDVWLSKGGQKVDCVSPDERKVDDYCLELKLHDSTRPSDFQCKFKEDVVYTCTNFNDCKESSALAERGAVPRSVSQKCSGIPFANMDHHFFGSYSCSSQDSTGAEVSGLHIISICKEESLLRPEEDDRKGDEDESWEFISPRLIDDTMMVTLLFIIFEKKKKERKKKREGQLLEGMEGPKVPPFIQEDLEIASNADAAWNPCHTLPFTPVNQRSGIATSHPLSHLSRQKRGQLDTHHKAYLLWLPPPRTDRQPPETHSSPAGHPTVPLRNPGREQGTSR